jgi:prepilin peptidase CpaA
MLKDVVLLVLLLVSVISDYKTFKISNKYVFPAALAGFIINMSYYGLPGLKFSIIGLIIPMLLLGVFFITGLIGAGDIKLFSAAGAIKGWEFVLYTMAYSFIFAAMAVFIKIAGQGNIKNTFSAFLNDLKMCLITCSISYFGISKAKHIIRLSPAIAVGACCRMLLS